MLVKKPRKTSWANLGPAPFAQDFGGAATRRCSQEPTKDVRRGYQWDGEIKTGFFSRFETTKKTYTLVSHEYSLGYIIYSFFFMCVRKMKSRLPYTPGYYFIGKNAFWGTVFFKQITSLILRIAREERIVFRLCVCFKMGPQSGQFDAITNNKPLLQ